MRTFLTLAMVMVGCGADPGSTQILGDAGADSSDAVDVALVCPSNWGDCEGNQANGCETRLDLGASNCGVCGNVCTSGLRQCRGGTCSP